MTVYIPWSCILINIEQVNIQLLSRTTCGNLLDLSLDRSYPTSSERVGLGSPLAACSVYGDLICSVHTINNFLLSIANDTICNRNLGPYVTFAKYAILLK